MALIQTAFIWVAWAVVVVLIALVAAIFVYEYQSPRERSALVSTVTILTLTSCLATVLLLPVDVALVSSTSSSKLGAKKSWATPDRVENILLQLRIVYYTLYSLDALLCLIVVPFTYFFYEEGDEIDEEDRQTWRQRIWAALKYTLIFVLLVILVFIIGFFVPVARGDRKHMDLDYFKKLLAENHGERAFTFVLGLLISLGTLIYIVYTAAGLSLMPISIIKGAPSISAPQLSATTALAIEQNRERQRQLELRNQGREGGMSSKDQRELEALIREERTLVRRERLANDASGEGRHFIVRAWTKICAVFRPLKLIGGALLLVIALVVWVSMLITGIDKAKNSICKQHCGYILGNINVFQPINWVFLKFSKIFPVDYVLMALLVLFFFSSSVVGIASIGIRFLWVKIFEIRKGRSTPQSLALASVMLTLMMLGFQYTLTMIIVPQYSIYGAQTFCSNPPNTPDAQPDCSKHPELIKPCSELSEDTASKNVCTPSVVSTFLNRATVNFPVFGALNFWAQFAFLAVFLVVFVTALVRTPKMNMNQLDADAEADEEEGLLASTGRRFGATWEDITGRSKAQNTNRGSAGRGSRGDIEDGDD